MAGLLRPRVVNPGGLPPLLDYDFLCRAVKLLPAFFK